MRKSYVYDPVTKKLVEGKAPKPADTGDRLMSDRLYDKLPPAHDGTHINTRTRHRQYMKRNNLTTIDDYQGTWEKAREKREAFYKGTDKQMRYERARDVAAAMEQRGRR